MRSCFDNNYYYVNDLLIIMNIKREVLKSLEHYAKIYLVKAETEELTNQIIRTLTFCNRDVLSWWQVLVHKQLTNEWKILMP